MSKNRDAKPKTPKPSDPTRAEPSPLDEQALSRRDFFKKSIVAGVGAATLGSLSQSAAQESPSTIEWDYEADVVVVGAGAMGLPSAIRARDLGASVLVIDQNYDVGGVMIHSGGQTSLGGGDPVQLRDLNGWTDPEGFVTVDRVEEPEAITDDVELLFRDMTDWSVLDRRAQAPYRYNEPDLHRAWADNCFDTRQFLMDNYVRFGRISGTHGTGGVSRARRAVAILRRGDVTDIRAGTVSAEDAGTGLQSSAAFPRELGDGSAIAGPDIVTGGGILSRCLEFSAREKGIEFMLNRHMDELIREEPFSGRVVGIRASYSPRHDPDTGEQLVSLWQDGSIEERRETVYIRARQAVVLGCGGHSGNPEFRSMFYPALRDPYFVTSGWALLGPNSRNASGIKAGLKIGATLAGMQQNLSYGTTFHLPTRLATRDAYTPMAPGHPTFPFRKSTGFTANANSREHCITVNQVGKRFFHELNLVRGAGSLQYPGTNAVPNPGVDHTPYSWRNLTVDWIRQSYNEHGGLHAAVQLNEGSTAETNWLPGPIWVIFDSAGLERAGWNVEPPFTHPDNGQFFVADTIEGLADAIFAGNEFQRMPLTHLRQTVDDWNAAVDAGVDEEFDRHVDSPMHRLDTPPFYAASQMLIWHDSYGGLRVNGRTQVIDLEGEVIPGLYAGGEASGGGNQHGLGRALVHGYIAGTNVVDEPAA